MKCTAADFMYSLQDINKKVIALCLKSGACRCYSMCTVSFQLQQLKQSRLLPTSKLSTAHAIA